MPNAAAMKTANAAADTLAIFGAEDVLAALFNSDGDCGTGVMGNGAGGGGDGGGGEGKVVEGLGGGGKGGGGEGEGGGGEGEGGGGKGEGGGGEGEGREGGISSQSQNVNWLFRLGTIEHDCTATNVAPQMNDWAAGC
jgi:hypothetical protein